MAPAIADTIAIAESLNRLMDTEQRTRVHGFGRGNDSTQPVLFTQDDGQFSSRISYVDTTVKTVKFTAGVLGNMQWPEGSLKRLRDLAGFTPEEFIPSLYELVPWSFLADYFTNLGGVVRGNYTRCDTVIWAIESTQTQSYRTVSQSVDRERLELRWPGRVIAVLGGLLYRGTGTKTSVTRRLLVPGELPAVSLQVYDLGLNFTQTANVMALLRAQAKRVTMTINVSRL